MKSRLILASAFILSVALPQLAHAAPATADAAQEQLLAAERARLQTARAELAAQSAAPATAPPAAPRAAPLSPEVAGAPGTPAAADSPDPVGAQPQTPPAAAGRPASPPPAIVTPGPVGGPSAGSLLQTILALSFVLALLAGLAWFMKRFGARAMMGGAANLRIVGSLNLGGRERLMVVEVGNQWIVIGASPGRVNALATMPKQEGAEQSATLAGHMPPAASFGEWLKQTIDKRNGK